MLLPVRHENDTSEDHVDATRKQSRRHEKENGLNDVWTQGPVWRLGGVVCPCCETYDFNYSCVRNGTWSGWEMN